MQCANLVLSCEIIIRITDVEIKRNIIMGFTLLSIGHCSVSIIAEYNEKWRSLQICKYYIFLEKRAINIVKKWPLTQKTHFHEISIENITKPWIIILNILYLLKMYFNIDRCILIQHLILNPSTNNDYIMVSINLGTIFHVF